MSTWNANHYLRFGAERTRPATDLASRIDAANPKTVVYLGCGPGNSTQVLRNRWPRAYVIGLDNSPEMIAAAQAAYPDQEWRSANIESWSSSQPFDIVFSNAALQWLGEHDRLVPRLFAQVSPGGGALAFQIPGDKYAAVRRHIHDIADDPLWRDRMMLPKEMLTMEEPSFYYDILGDHARKLNIRETEYYHVVDSPTSIVDWISSTGLRPFLDVLDSSRERRRFVDMLSTRVTKSYPARGHGKILFPFRRLFVVAYRELEPVRNGILELSRHDELA